MGAAMGILTERQLDQANRYFRTDARMRRAVSDVSGLKIVKDP